MTVPRLASSLSRGCATCQSRLSLDICRPSVAPFQTRNKSGRRGFGFSARRRAADLSGLKEVLKVSEEVADAVATNKPVVALESTIYTHGAFQEDLGLEEIVRNLGAVPAVCGVYHGIATVGLEKAEIQEMVQGNPSKLSRRDLAFIVGDGLRGVKRHGGTTIAGTMILARLAGIRVFGTGGLGGVHRGAESSMDISADLTELGRTRVAVISAGCKGFLDIPRTLEYLETQGVVVSTFNTTGDPNAHVPFPAFWARDSGVKSPSVLQGPEDAAYKIYAQEKLGLESGLLFANPIPEEASIPREVMEDAIDKAVRDADQEGFTGSNNTPFILQRIKKYTEGRSVEANLALVRSNVTMATKVALSLSDILKSEHSASDPQVGESIFVSSPESEPRESKVPAVTADVDVADVAENEVPPSIALPEQKSATTEAADEEVMTILNRSHRGSIAAISRAARRKRSKANRRFDIVVAGAVALDLSCDYAQEGTPVESTSNPAIISQSVGGVGHNVALAAHRFLEGEASVKLCSVVGDDVAGHTILQAMRASGLSTSGIEVVSDKSNRTAQYVAVNDSEKSLVLAMADMDIVAGSAYPTSHWIKAIQEAQPRCLVVDANLPADRIRALLSVAGDATTAFEPVSVAKSVRLFDGPEKLGVYPNHLVDLITPNIYELTAMYDAAMERGYFHDAPKWEMVVDQFNLDGTNVDYEDYFERILDQASDEVKAADIPQKMLHLLPYIPKIVVKLGDQGCVFAEILSPDDKILNISKEEDLRCGILSRSVLGATKTQLGGILMRHLPVKPVEDVVSVNGVGDTFLGVVAAGLSRRHRLRSLINYAQSAARMTLRSSEAVSPDLGKLNKKLAKWATHPRGPLDLTLASGRNAATSSKLDQQEDHDESDSELVSGNESPNSGMDRPVVAATTDVQPYVLPPTVVAESNDDASTDHEDAAPPSAPTESTSILNEEGETAKDSETTGADHSTIPLAIEQAGGASVTTDLEASESVPGSDEIAAEDAQSASEIAVADAENESAAHLPESEASPATQNSANLETDAERSVAKETSADDQNASTTETEPESKEDEIKNASPSEAAEPENKDEGTKSTSSDLDPTLPTSKEAVGPTTIMGWQRPSPIPPTKTPSPNQNPTSAKPAPAQASNPIKGPTQPTKPIPVASKIHQALAKMRVSDEDAQEAIRVVTSQGPSAFAKWKSDYQAKMAAQKAAARAEARKAAEEKNKALKNRDWGSFARDAMSEEFSKFWK